MGKQKYMGIMLLTVMLAGALTGCQNSGHDKIVLKLGHVANLEQPCHLASEKFAEMVYERSGGEIEIQVFPNSQLGGQRELLEGIQFGSIDIALTSSAVMGNFIPTTQVMDLPFIFRDSKHVYDVVDGPLADKIYAGSEEKT